MNPNIPIADIMTRQVVTATPDMSLSKIHGIFEDHPFHHLVVLDKGEVVGVISKSDYFQVRHMLAISWGGDIRVQECYAELAVSDIMSKKPVCVESSDTIGLAAALFMGNRFHCLPVVDGGELVGVITTHDLLFYAYQSAIETEDQFTTSSFNPHSR